MKSQEEIKEPPSQKLTYSSTQCNDQELLDTLQLSYKYSNVSQTSSSYEQIFKTPVSPLRFVHSSELFSLIQAKVGEMQSQMQIHSDLILYLLCMFRWNTQKLQQVYYNNYYHQFIIKNKLIYTNNNRYQQEICSVCLSKDKLYSSALCPHAYCRGCWHDYLSERINQQQILFPCLNGSQCQGNPILRHFVDEVAPDLSTKYIKQICINYARECRTVSECCNTHCQFFCEKNPTVECEVVQCVCDAVYCFKCSREVHWPVDCSEYGQWNKVVEQNNELWLKLFAKHCPDCNNLIEKTVGCGKMTCICSCVFCYFCGEKWSQNHVESGCLDKNKDKNYKTKEIELLSIRRKIMQFECEKYKHSQMLDKCLREIGVEEIIVRLRDLKKIITKAWNMLKWCQIGLYLKQNHPIRYELEKDYLEKIYQLIEPAEGIMNLNAGINSSHIPYYIEKVNNRRQTLLKTQAVWIAAYHAAQDNGL